MNTQALLHISESPYASLVSEKDFCLRLRLASEDKGLSIYAHFGGKYPFPTSRDKIPMALAYLDSEFAYFEAIIPVKDKRLAYVFEIVENGQSHFFTEKGLTDHYDFACSYKDFFQFPYLHQIDVPSLPSWLKGAFFYQIFPDRFKLGDKGKDLSYVNLDWGGAPTPQSFAGGDLEGIRERLPYLASLGVNALYLTPIFLSPSYHKYDIVDYLKIDPQLGDEKTLKRLIDDAHKAGIRLVLDAVFNHLSSQSLFFQDAVKNGRKSPYWDWFFVHGDHIDLNKPNYEYFSVCPYMPKLNPDSSTCAAYLKKVALHYLDLGIDGWRLDVADEVSHEFWRDFRKAIKSAYPEALILGEHWHNPHAFLKGDEFDGVMNYPLTYALESYLASKNSDARHCASEINRIFANIRPSQIQGNLNLLDSHDTFRFYTLCKENIDLLECALAALVFMPGCPGIYYGTEIPLPGNFDPDSRRCFPLDGEKPTAHSELLRNLIVIHTKQISHLSKFRCQEIEGLLRIERSEGGQGLELYINATDHPVQLKGDDHLLAHRYESKHIEPNGFLIRRLQK